MEVLNLNLFNKFILIRVIIGSRLQLLCHYIGMVIGKILNAHWISNFPKVAIWKRMGSVYKKKVF